ncbi:MAG: hypothetical protein ACFFC7_33675 [Candidatus Hermodarchaeota archaeon]
MLNRKEKSVIAFAKPEDVKNVAILYLNFVHEEEEEKEEKLAGNLLKS